MSRSKVKANSRHLVGYTLFELLLTLALVSGLCLSLLGLVASKQPNTSLQPQLVCGYGYWQSQQRFDEQWMFGESHEQQCKQK